jgi:site-specific DNA-methyltransferase (adenine-specific)
MAKHQAPNALYYGDNLEILRRKIKDETVDLCYIDPPFNSKRTYNQIYNRVGKEDRAQAQAFTDTWVWDEHASSGYEEILANDGGRFQAQLIELIKGLNAVLGKESLLAYLVSMSLRITEIQRVLKSSGSFYLHCDPTSSHYLKLILDSVFVTQGGDFRNEIVWCYKSGGASKLDFAKKHDVIFRYSKGRSFTFNYDKEKSYGQTGGGQGGKVKYYKDEIGTYSIVGIKDWWTISMLSTTHSERLGYPTQKPEALLERIIKASSNEGDVVLDAYCGCGTTVAVAQALKRKWIGMDITYQSISLVLRRLEHKFGKSILNSISLDGIPRDMKSAVALAHKTDDRLRKEFEKWTVLTYTNNRAIINEKKGADAGIDARAFFMTGKKDNAKIIFQVKSGGVKRGDIATLRGDMGREDAALAVLITLEEPSQPMIDEAKKAGSYKHETMGHTYDKISIVTVKEIVEDNKRLEIPMSLEVVAAAKREAESKQIDLL